MHSLRHAPCHSVAILLVMLGLLTSPGYAAEPFAPARVAVYFSPNGGATEAVVREVGAAQQQILVQAYSFTSAPIAKALVDAHKRGVNVLAVLDKSNQTGMALPETHAACVNRARACCRGTRSRG